jgi:hypothetical protein
MKFRKSLNYVIHLGKTCATLRQQFPFKIFCSKYIPQDPTDQKNPFQLLRELFQCEQLSLEISDFFPLIMKSITIPRQALAKDALPLFPLQEADISSYVSDTRSVMKPS